MCLFVYSASNVHCTPTICQNTKPMKANNQYQYLKIDSNRDMVLATSTSTCKLIVIVSEYTFGEDCCCSAVFLVFRIWYLVCQGNQSMWGVDSCCCASIPGNIFIMTMALNCRFPWKILRLRGSRYFIFIVCISLYMLFPRSSF